MFTFLHLPLEERYECISSLPSYVLNSRTDCAFSGSIVNQSRKRTTLNSKQDVALVKRIHFINH